MYALIKKKRDGSALSRSDLQRIVQDYVAGKIPDYQVAALLMAIYFRGMSTQETVDLTHALVASGDTIDLTGLPGITVDKHSTGGVGDKTTLVLGPMLAAAGLTVAKMSGRGLGHTGGTLDKLESIPGFRTDLTPAEMLDQVRGTGIAVVAQTASLVPADGLLYALRDVTATVDSLPLIASSVMSKKLAAGAQAIVLDVKTGSGAFMSQPDQAFELAHTLVDIGTAAGRSVRAVVSSMDQPLGKAVGNALEVLEAIETLKGGGPADLRELCLALASELVGMTQPEMNRAEARGQLESLLDGGAALRRFRELVVAQHGDGRVVDDPGAVLPKPGYSLTVAAPTDGYVAAIDALIVGEAARALGAGRQRKGDSLDPAAGVELRSKVGDRLQAGVPWATVHASDHVRAAKGARLLETALTVSAERTPGSRLILGIVGPNGTETRL